MPARGRPPTMSRQRDRGTVRRTHPIDLISSEPNQRIPPSPWESCLGPFWNDSWAAIQDPPLRDAQRSQDTAVDLDIKVDVKAAHGYVFALRRTSWSADVSPPDGPQPGVRLMQPLSPRPRFRCSQCRQAIGDASAAFGVGRPVPRPVAFTDLGQRAVRTTRTEALSSCVWRTAVSASTGP